MGRFSKSLQEKKAEENDVTVIEEKNAPKPLKVEKPDEIVGEEVKKSRKQTARRVNNSKKEEVKYTKDGRKKQKPGPKGGNRKSAISIYTTTEVVEKLDKLAEKENISRAELVHRILVEKIKDSEKLN